MKTCAICLLVLVLFTGSRCSIPNQNDASLVEKCKDSDLVLKGWIQSISFTLIDKRFMPDDIIITCNIHAEKTLWPRSLGEKKYVVEYTYPIKMYGDFKKELNKEGIMFLRIKDKGFDRPQLDVLMHEDESIISVKMIEKEIDHAESYEPWGRLSPVTRGDSFEPLDREAEVNDMIKNRKTLLDQ